MSKAIETIYNGYRFRSRLEARWAVFFDTLGIEYEYEKEGYDLGEAGWYLPDFWLPEHKAHIEIKGKDPSSDEVHKITMLGKESGDLVFLYCGIPKSDHEGTNYPYYTNWDGFFIKSTSNAKNIEIPMDAKEFDGDVDYGFQMKCPHCKDNSYVSFGDPISIDCDDYSAWEGRGGSTRIPMSCEGGCKWTIRLGFHKGQTYIKCEDIEWRNEDFMYYIAAEKYHDCDRFCEALVAAKQARFEHGETPRP